MYDLNLQDRQRFAGIQKLVNFVMSVWMILLFVQTQMLIGAFITVWSSQCVSHHDDIIMYAALGDYSQLQSL
jgi:hypothetical protein